MAVTLTCKCCGFTETLPDSEAAFQAGWDEPTHMASWPVTCPLCPGVASLGLVDHSAAHERWAREGRPTDYQADDGTFAPEVIAGVERMKATLAALPPDATKDQVMRAVMRRVVIDRKE